MEGSKFHVLVVDDDPASNAALSKVLEDGGYGVRSAKDGLDALNKLFDGGPKPDLIILDLIMPRMNGFAFLRAIEQMEFNDVPVVLISGANPRDMPDAPARRNYVFVSKAMDVEEILDTIRAKLIPSDPPLPAA